MRRGRAFLRRLGLRLALAALVVQAAIPFLVAAEVRAATAQAAAVAVIGQSLCLHDGAPSQGGTPHSDCTLAFCPLCAALAAASTLGAPGQDAPSMPLVARAAPFLAEASYLPVRGAIRTPYQSRAPPLV